MRKLIFFLLAVATVLITLPVACSVEHKKEALITDVLLSQSIAVLIPGGTLNLSATVLPTDAENQTVNWVSSNPAVATVSLGLVTALAEGTTTITVITDHGNKSATCLVSVAEAIPTTITMQQSGIETVTISVKGTGTTTVEWGDGSSPEITLNPTSYTHTYSITSSRSITITGENITQLDCSSMGIHSLNLSSNNTLLTLICFGNQLTNLDVHDCSALSLLYCNDNQLINLNVSGCSGLTELWCYNNKLTSLALNECDALTKLWCQKNLLTTLNVDECSSLLNLDCNDNRLSGLSVSASVLLVSLNCSNNLLQASALNTLFESLHRNNISTGKSILISNNPGSAVCNRSIATNKGWVLY